MLVVEDEFLLAQAVCRLLRRKGAVPVGPAASVASALSILDTESVDCAVLDINLTGETVYPFADVLLERNIPYLFVTGYSSPPRPPHHEAKLLIKPVDDEQLSSELRQLLTRPRS